MFDKISINLNDLIATRDVSVVQLSRATGVPASTIKKIRNSSNMNPTLATLIPIARFFSVSLDYLISDHEASKTHSFSREQNELRNEWPLISWEKAIYWPGTNESLQKKVISTQNHGPQAFALQVGVEDLGVFKQGTVLIVDPSILPNHRDYVVVFKEGQTKASLKIFLSSDENKFLQSVCIAEDVVPLTFSHKIIGVVMEYWKQLKSSNEVAERSVSALEQKQLVSI